jgi:hypothetical protein
MTHYTYQGHELSAKTDIGARRQVQRLIREGRATGGSVIEFFRDSDHCRGQMSL